MLTFSNFILCTQTPCADVKPFPLAANGKSNRMNIGQPVAPGMMLGMTDIMTKLWYLTT